MTHQSRANEIRQEFDQLATEFNDPRTPGGRCYEISCNLIRLSNEHHRLTGSRLVKPPRRKVAR